MARYRLFLAYYTLVASTALFLWAIFVSSKAESLILAVLFLPCGLYFWLSRAKILEEGEKPAKIWPMVVVAIIASFLSSLVYGVIIKNARGSDSLAIGNLTQELHSLNSQPSGAYPAVATELKAIKNRLTGLESGVLGASQSQYSAVTIKDSQTPTLNVYQSKDPASNVVAKIEYGKTYLFLGKDPSWYLVFIPPATGSGGSGQEGYIDAKLVKEVPN